MPRIETACCRKSLNRKRHSCPERSEFPRSQEARSRGLSAKTTSYRSLRRFRIGSAPEIRFYLLLSKPVHARGSSQSARPPQDIEASGTQGQSTPRDRKAHV